MFLTLALPSDTENPYISFYQSQGLRGILMSALTSLRDKERENIKENSRNCSISKAGSAHFISTLYPLLLLWLCKTVNDA